MARGIVRWSIDGESSNVTGNVISKLLSDTGADRVGTSAWEFEHPDVGEVLAILAQIVDLVRSPPGGGYVDHLWVYIDRTG